MNADEKACPRCAETIKRAALICRFCRHEFEPAIDPPVEDPVQVSEGTATAIWIALGVVCLIAILAALSQCSSQQTELAADNLATENLAVDNLVSEVLETNAASPEAPASPPGWEYADRADEVRGERNYRAWVSSENEANFDFPYEGGSSLLMTVRKHPEYGEDVIFVISKGQFVCGTDDCGGTINFGSGPEYISLVEPEDNSSDTLFVSNAEYVIGRLKKADKVIVELPFYQEGNRQFTFHTKGLIWPPKGAKVEPALDDLQGGE